MTSVFASAEGAVSRRREANEKLPPSLDPNAGPSFEILIDQADLQRVVSNSRRVSGHVEPRVHKLSWQHRRTSHRFVEHQQAVIERPRQMPAIRSRPYRRISFGVSSMEIDALLLRPRPPGT